MQKIFTSCQQQPNEEIKELQQALEKAFPGFEDLSTISDAGFTPHLSVGQWKNEVRTNLKSPVHVGSIQVTIEFYSSYLIIRSKGSLGILTQRTASYFGVEDG